MRHRSLLLSATACLAVASAASHAGSVLTDWNVIVRGNVFSTSEVDGSALIGGNLSGPASNYAVQGVTASNGDGLVVGGNINAGTTANINNGGNLRIGGSMLGTRNLNGGGSQINSSGVSSMVTNAINQVVSMQASLAALATNGSIDGAGNMNASPTNYNGANVAVYAFNISTIQGLGQLNLNFGSADTVILNVTSNNGVINLVAPPNLIGGFNQNNSSKILWNFIDATEITVNNTFNGALIAPDADLRILGGGVNGSVVVDSISFQNAEIRRHTYTGWLPPEDDTPMIPLPTGGAMALAGMLAIGARRRR